VSATPRVVSLVPSATESLLDLGVEPVACTRFCEQPDLPHVGGTKDPDLDAVIALAPDLVVMCEEENLLAHHDALVAAGLETFTFRVDGVEDVGPQLAALAELVGVPSPPSWEPPPMPPVRLRAFVPIWRRPWMSLGGGTYGSSLLAHLGVVNVFADAAVRYPEVTLEEARARRTDLVLLPTEPYPFAERHRAQVAEVAPATLVDGQDLFWWGTRTPAAFARLAGAVDRIVAGVGP
jgi:ABC-type Fe3+-hydroxamate transport system substrate-binding protein